MTITPLNQITTAAIAHSDQDLAKFHERANALDKAIAVAIYPTPGDACGTRGCTLPANIVIAALYGKPERVDVPVCERHFEGGKVIQPILAWAIEMQGFAVEPGAEYREWSR